MGKNKENSKTPLQPSAKKIRRQARVAGLVGGASRSLAKGAAVEAILFGAEQPPAATVLVGTVALAGAGLSVFKGAERKQLRKEAATAQRYEDQQKAVQARMAEIRGDQVEPQKRGVIRRVGSWAIRPFLNTEAANRKNIAQQPRILEQTQGAQAVRSLVEQWDTAVQHRQDLGRLDATPPTPEPAPQPETPHPVAPAPPDQKPFPITAILHR